MRGADGGMETGDAVVGLMVGVWRGGGIWLAECCEVLLHSVEDTGVQRRGTASQHVIVGGGALGGSETGVGDGGGGGFWLKCKLFTTVDRGRTSSAIYL